MMSVSPDRVPTGGDALWSRAEVLTQASQSRGQVDIWEAIAETIAEPCEGCGADSGEACRVGRLGLAQAVCTCPPSGFLCDGCDPT